jgi:hypothetical protein
LFRGDASKKGYVIRKKVLTLPFKNYEKSSQLFFYLNRSRVARTRKHKLEDILFIAIASIICSAESWNDMEEFGKAKEEWLKTFLSLPGGIPSHDTINRLFSALNPDELGRCFMS